MSGGGGDRSRSTRSRCERAVTALVRCALRHGGLEHVDARRRRARARRSRRSRRRRRRSLLGEDLRDLGAAVAVRVLRALGGDVSVEDGRPRAIRLAGC